MAVVADRLIDYALWRPGRPDGVGDLHRGRITAHARALAGSFVALGDAQPDGFLPDSACEGAPLAGRLLGVRVTRAAQASKGPRLTGRLDHAAAALAAEGPVRVLQRGPDPVRRLAARTPDAAIAIDDPAMAALLRPDLADRLHLVRRAFDSAVEDEVAGLALAEIDLPGGGRVRVQPTAALTAIDVDLGAGAGGSARSKTATHRAFAAAILPELARQIRLRNFAGAILIDLAGLSVSGRAALAPALREALTTDPIECRLMGFTGLGFAEILRARIHPPLHELLAGPHAAAIAAARAAAGASTQAAPALRLRAAPAVLRAIETDAVLRAALEQATCHALVLETAELPTGGWRLERARDGALIDAS